VSIGYFAMLYPTVTLQTTTALALYTGIRTGIRLLGTLCLWIAIGWMGLHPAERMAE
jgi:hypothetical protein